VDLNLKIVSPNKQAGFSQIAILILLLVGLVAGIYLVQQRTNLFSKAYLSTTGVETEDFLFRLVYYRDQDVVDRYQCQLNPQHPLGANIEPKNCLKLTPLAEANIQYTSEYLAPYTKDNNVVPHLFRLIYYKDGTYREERCTVGEQVASPYGVCTPIRSLNIGTEVQYTSEYVANYQGTDYLFRLIYLKNGDYKEYRCDLDPNSPMGAQLDPSGCAPVRSLNIGSDLQYTSEYLTGTEPRGLVRLIYYKDGSYYEYRCSLDPSNPMGADLELRNCEPIRSTNLGTSIQHTSDFIAPTRKLHR
jgi:hypothetical protein